MRVRDGMRGLKDCGWYVEVGEMVKGRVSGLRMGEMEEVKVW